jgi:DNA-binding phage protein
MTTYLQEQLNSASYLEDAELSPAILGYFHAMSQDEAHDLILELFDRLSREKNITKAFIARRLHKQPEQVTRWLSAPGNWTMDTFTNLAVALGHKPKLGLESLEAVSQNNDTEADPVEGAQPLNFRFDQPLVEINADSGNVFRVTT